MIVFRKTYLEDEKKILEFSKKNKLFINNIYNTVIALQDNVIIGFGQYAVKNKIAYLKNLQIVKDEIDLKEGLIRTIFYILSQNKIKTVHIEIKLDESLLEILNLKNSKSEPTSINLKEFFNKPCISNKISNLKVGN